MSVLIALSIVGGLAGMLICFNTLLDFIVGCKDVYLRSRHKWPVMDLTITVQNRNRLMVKIHNKGEGYASRLTFIGRRKSTMEDPITFKDIFQPKDQKVIGQCISESHIVLAPGETFIILDVKAPSALWEDQEQMNACIRDTYIEVSYDVYDPVLDTRHTRRTQRFEVQYHVVEFA